MNIPVIKKQEQQTFLEKTVNIIFMYLLLPFTVQNLKKSLEQIQSYEDTLLSPKRPICPTQNDRFAARFFFGKPISTTFVYLLATFIVQNLKTILGVDPEL